MKTLILLSIFNLFCISQASPNGLDVNDVSYLFPLDSRHQPFPEIPLNSGLINEELFSDVLSLEQHEQDTTATGTLERLRREYLFRGSIITNLAKWRVVSFRYSHCGDPSVLKGSVLTPTQAPCSAYLRVVAQPIADEPIDSALHLLYNLGPAPKNQNNPILQKLLNLRDEAQKFGVVTAGLPLQTHPALVQALGNTKSHFDQAVTNFISDVLGPTPVTKLDMITVIATTNIKTWKFIGGVIQKDPKTQKLDWVGFNTPIYKNLNKVIPQTLTCDGSSLCDFTPSVLLPKTIRTASNKDFPNLSKLFREKNTDQYKPSLEFQDISEIIDNPSKANLFNTDCISCHQTANIRNKAQLLQSDQGFPLGITPFVSGNYLKGNPTFIINFGYQQSSARISVRTAAESAVVANSVNDILKANTPRPVCKPEQQNALWNCLNNIKGSSNPLTCYQRFCK